MKVTIIGTGYVGLITGVTLAYLGHEVRCVDAKQEVVATLQRGGTTFHEPGLSSLMAASHATLSFREQLPSLRGDGVVMIAVGTPAKENGEADLAYVDTAAHQVAAAIEPGARLTVVNKSTVPIGSARHVEGIIARALVERGVDAEVDVVSNPEFLAEGQAVHDSLYPDRIVIGAERRRPVDVLREMYAPLLEQTFEPPVEAPRPERFPLPPLITTTATSAELTKYAANAFLATKISFVNEFAGLAERVGADVTQVARAIGLDDRIGTRFLQAGIGWGGSCFGKDTSAIMATASTYDYGMPIVASAVEVNRRQRLRVVEKLQEHLKVLRGTTVGLLGLSFKAHTDDLRDAPALTLIEMLSARGARLRVHDPVSLPRFRAAHPDVDVDTVDDVADLPRGCDAVVVVTEWPEYRSLDLERTAADMKGRVLVDARNILSPDAVRGAGLRYVGMGR